MVLLDRSLDLFGGAFHRRWEPSRSCAIDFVETVDPVGVVVYDESAW